MDEDEICGDKEGECEDELGHTGKKAKEESVSVTLNSAGAGREIARKAA